MSRDQRAWIEDLARQHGRMIFDTAYRMLGNTHDAEDVLQEVLLKVLNGSVRSKAVRDWGAFLRVMASRRTIDLLRKNSRRHETRDPTGTTADSSNHLTRNVLERRRKAALLRQALGRLPHRDAEVFSLRYLEEFSYDQIAAQLNLGQSQVGVILHRTRKRLQEILDPMLGPSLSKETNNG